MKTYIMKYAIIISFLLCLIACKNENTGFGFSGNQVDFSGSASTEPSVYLPAKVGDINANYSELEPPMTAEPPGPPEVDLVKGSKLIKTGNYNFEVDNLEKAKTKVDTLKAQFKSYYESELYNSYGNRVTYSIKLRIPNANFDGFVSELENGIGEVLSKKIHTDDVTAEFVDLNIRLNNNLAYLEQYREILKKAKTIKEILEVKEQIRILEEEIESKKGRLKYLADQVQYSTLHLEISQLISQKISKQPGFLLKISNAFRSGFNSFLGFIIGIVHLWPFIIIGFLIIVFRKKIASIYKR